MHVDAKRGQRLGGGIKPVSDLPQTESNVNVTM